MALILEVVADLTTESIPAAGGDDGGSPAHAPAAGAGTAGAPADEMPVPDGVPAAGGAGGTPAAAAGAGAGADDGAAGAGAAAAPATKPWTHDGDRDAERRRELLAFTFDPVQIQVIEQAQKGENIFLTGVAGTGKSAVTERIVSDAKAAGREVAVAAPTGVAALNIGGCTLHSVAKLKPPTTAGDFGSMYATAKDSWRQMNMLVLDEVGMVKADFLEWMDWNVRGIRGCLDKPFGGIQLIFVGDFAQLGPVNIGPSLSLPARAPTASGADLVMDLKELCHMSFQTAMWREAKFRSFQLKQIHRQSGDEDLVSALLDIREGKTDSVHVQQLKDYCARPLEPRVGSDGLAIEPTVLYVTNSKVNLENNDKLNELRSELRTFVAKDSVQVDIEVAQEGTGAHTEAERHLWGRGQSGDKFFSKDCPARREIELKIGAQVMCVKNLPYDDKLDPLNRIVNGSCGVIVRYEPNTETQYADWPADQEWPVVRFTNAKANRDIEKRIEPEDFDREVYRCGICVRKQIPLRLAWALTIHKAQGATLPRVVVDLQGCFCHGQAYVALSRATSRDGLQIINFSEGCVTASKLVKRFYDSLHNPDATCRVLEEAGLWWFPLRDEKHASWLKLFREAQGNRRNSKQFRKWMDQYPAIEPGGATGGAAASVSPAASGNTPPTATAAQLLWQRASPEQLTQMAANKEKAMAIRKDKREGRSWRRAIESDTEADYWVDAMVEAGGCRHKCRVVYERQLKYRQIVEDETARAAASAGADSAGGGAAGAADAWDWQSWESSEDEMSPDGDGEEEEAAGDAYDQEGIEAGGDDQEDVEDTEQSQNAEADEDVRPAKRPRVSPS